MTTVAQLLAGEAGGVYPIPPGVARGELEREARRRGLFYARADLAAARSQSDLVLAVARALRFPGWFGGGLDALADCAGDLSWLSDRGWVLVLDGVAGLDGLDGVAETAPDGFAAVLEILREAAASWAQEGKPFIVLLGGAHPRELPP